MTDTLLVTPHLWATTWDGLAQRCDNQREAACIWGGRRNGSRLQCTSVVFLDDFPGVRSARLYHITPPAATAMLLDMLRQRDECIVADVHAHPGAWVGQSQTDMEHPIEYRIGLLALILPYFAGGMRDLGGVGLHEYLGNFQWRALTSDETVSHLRVDGVI